MSLRSFRQPYNKRPIQYFGAHTAQVSDHEYAAVGIYAIICHATGNAYVGSSRNATSRMSGHLSQLRCQSHPNRALLSDWNQHGEISFEFRFIESVADFSRLHERERFWIEKMGTLNKRIPRAA